MSSLNLPTLGVVQQGRQKEARGKWVMWLHHVSAKTKSNMKRRKRSLRRCHVLWVWCCMSALKMNPAQVSVFPFPHMPSSQSICIPLCKWVALRVCSPNTGHGRSDLFLESLPLNFFLSFFSIFSCFFLYFISFFFSLILSVSFSFSLSTIHSIMLQLLPLALRLILFSCFSFSAPFPSLPYLLHLKFFSHFPFFALSISLTL